ncbi:DegT/DnrJ/EryC1/StrS family aminotransferase [Reinekea marinisedimentorum]|uniref:dTDP-4-amino-4,6-dideoxygalactose transaminase n=1 Tax=Reinekea marinisedimentorum TaxID=230495 RepID=A0A4R3I5B0_9GAMM|nr:DegT/DnrJ/EryC1/StrS family aminotransferase [Reinekea marinisedimentorum]TCS40301.1 dTDP-4-amino-4,6-dideoxygalactose transaminase [Reinekea marinisedimentorum]
MKFKSLPPVNSVVSFRKVPLSESLLPGYQIKFVGSGTQALAYALSQIKLANPGIDKPEVIVPGYCCPDLLSAAIYAGYLPVLVDICENDPSYDLAQLEQAITSNTLAVIAVNFMGIKERLADISVLLQRYPKIKLIEDNAQWFPDENEVSELTANFVTFSFGRGKPVSLYEGGLVAIKRSEPVVGLPIQKAEQFNELKWRLKALVIVLLSKPVFYFWLEKAPFLRLGATRYKRLDTIQELPAGLLSFVQANIDAYRSRSREIEAKLKSRFETVNCLNDVIVGRGSRLLRFPLLLENNSTASDYYSKLKEQGAGVSRMYADYLMEVEGVSTLTVRKTSELMNSSAFAKRFLTLPVDKFVEQSEI